MALHIFQYEETDIFALTHDETGANLPMPKHGEWRFIETLDLVQVAWGEENFNEDVRAALDANGYFLFEGEKMAAEDVFARPSKRV